jgi:4-hydroxy-tetrahydrodipicolinate synthase
MARSLKGLYEVLVTPLDENREQDIRSLTRLIDYCLDAGVEGLTVLGESAEVDRLSGRERVRNVAAVMKHLDGRVPIVFGASQDGTQLAVQSSLWAEERGADAVMIAPPRNTRLRDAAILDYYAAIGDAISIPIVVQDIPESNHPYMSPALIARINSEVRNAKYLKLEDPPTPIKLTKVRELVKDRMKIFGALAAKGCLWELDRGAVGIMTASPTPEYLVGIWDAHRRGDRRRASEVFFYSLPLVYAYGEVGISVRKEILKRRGIIRTSKLKTPSAELDDIARAEVGELLDWTEKKIEETSGIKPLGRRRASDNPV